MCVRICGFTTCFAFIVIKHLVRLLFFLLWMLLHRSKTRKVVWIFCSCLHQVDPLSGLLEGGTMVTISGSNLGQKAEDIVQSVLVADVPCTVISNLYEVSSRYARTTVVSQTLFVLKTTETWLGFSEEQCWSSRIVCMTKASGLKTSHVSVRVNGGEFGLSRQKFSYQV